jgi:predicted P-loop ATPase/GTPase
LTRILITGINTLDSGKTTFAIQFLKKLIEQGHHVEYFKPISGHNYWYHYNHTRKCLEMEQLFSFDADKARQHYNSRAHIYITNPVHTLYVPANIERPSRVYLPTTLALAGWDSVLAMKRFSQSSEKGIQSMMFLANSLVTDDELIITPDEVEKLSSTCETTPISTMEEISAFEQQCLENVVQSSFEHLEDLSDVLLIESFNNSAWPWESLDYVDKVFTIGPGHLFQYEPSRFRKAALMLQRGSLPIREVTLSRVDELLKPISRVPLIPSKEIIDSLGQLMNE